MTLYPASILRASGAAMTTAAIRAYTFAIIRAREEYRDHPFERHGDCVAAQRADETDIRRRYRRAATQARYRQRQKEAGK